MGSRVLQAPERVNAQHDRPVTGLRLSALYIYPVKSLAGIRVRDRVHTWRRLSIGALRLRFARRCARCSVTTVDPDTGGTGTEPLATLASYRGGEGGVYFGVNLLPENTGLVAEGDYLQVLA